MSKFLFMTEADPENGKWDGISVRDLTINLFMHKFIEPRWDSWADLNIVFIDGSIGKVTKVEQAENGDLEVFVVVPIASWRSEPEFHRMEQFIERIQFLHKQGMNENAKIKFHLVGESDVMRNIRIIEIKDNTIFLREFL